MIKVARQLNSNKDRDGKLFNFRPITFCACFLALGVVLGYFVVVKGSSPWFGLALLPVAFIVVVSSLKKTKWISCTLVLCLFSLVGALSFYGGVLSFQAKNVYDGEYSVAGVVEEKSRYGDGYYIVLDEISIGGNAEKGKLVAYLPTALGENVHLADEIVMTCTVKTDVSLQSGEKFRAAQIASDEAFRGSAVSSLEVVGQAARPLLIVRQKICDALFAGLDSQSAAFGAGLLLGDDSGIESGLLQNVRAGGIAHLFAVSGLHIGVLFALCLWITTAKFFRDRNKFFSWLFVAVMLLFYGGICGFTPSVFRAVFTCLFAYAYRLFGIKRDNLEGVSFAALLLLLISPSYLFDVGFLLSFAACYGVLLFVRPLSEAFIGAAQSLCDFCKYRVCKKEKTVEKRSIFDGDTPPDGIGARAIKKGSSFAAVTISAWLSTLPICIGFFGRMSAWGFLLNLLFVPVLSTFYIFLLALTILACLFPMAAPVLFFVPNAILGGVILFFELIPFGMANIPFSIAGAICLYLALLCLTDKFNLPKKQKTILAVTAAAAAILCFLFPLFL